MYIIPRMSKKERVIARIDLLKVLIVAFLGALFAVFGYTALHYKEFDLALGILVGIGAILLIIGISVFIIIYEKKLDELEKL